MFNDLIQSVQQQKITRVQFSEWQTLNNKITMIVN